MGNRLDLRWLMVAFPADTGGDHQGVCMEDNQDRITWSVLLIVMLACSFVVVFWPTMTSLVNAWGRGEDNSHGFLIVPVSMYLLWGKRGDIARLRFQPSLWGIVLIVLSLVLYVVSRHAGILTLAPFAMVLLLQGIVIYLLGFRIFNELIFPLLFLFLMIPVPSQIYSAMTIPLQLLVTKASVFIVDFLGVAVLREGNVIHLAEKTFQVVRACSGLRSLVALLALTLIVGYMTLRTCIGRTVLVAAGLPVAITVNILRVVLMVLAFHWFRFDLTDDSVHSLFGMVIFCIALLIVTFIQRMVAHWETCPEAE